MTEVPPNKFPKFMQEALTYCQYNHVTAISGHEGGYISRKYCPVCKRRKEERERLAARRS